MNGNIQKRFKKKHVLEIYSDVQILKDNKCALSS